MEASKSIINNIINPRQDKKLLYSFNCMCGWDIDSQLGLKSHYRTCDIMNMSFMELLSVFNKFSEGNDLGQLMNMHSITEYLLDDLNKRIIIGL